MTRLCTYPQPYTQAQIWWCQPYLCTRCFLPQEMIPPKPPRSAPHSVVFASVLELEFYPAIFWGRLFTQQHLRRCWFTLTAWWLLFLLKYLPKSLALRRQRKLHDLELLGDLEDGCSVSPARSWVTYGCSAGLPKPYPDLPGHVVRCSRWPSSGASQAMHSGALHEVQTQDARICSGPFTKTNDAVAALRVPLKSPCRVEDPLCCAQAAQHCIIQSLQTRNFLSWAWAKTAALWLFPPTQHSGGALSAVFCEVSPSLCSLTSLPGPAEAMSHCVWLVFLWGFVLFHHALPF